MSMARAYVLSADSTQRQTLGRRAGVTYGRQVVEVPRPEMVELIVAVGEARTRRRRRDRLRRVVAARVHRQASGNMGLKFQT